ncbi:protein FAM92A-like [Contarinia nasturtii]|uniref:protein FAM92A-like n=1 Tax=Contarinia nasturtii TaxID=265458 RepID=UPI0012D3C706|nr:protein FAM92A-like [Contarinia nasturtii]
MPQDGKKMIFDRIQMTENFFGDLCSELSSFTKKKARLRDKYDELGRIFRGYAESARFNETLFNGLLNYSKSCTALADIKDIEVRRLQSKTLRDLANYENVCKNARDALKHSLLARGKEHFRQRANQRNSLIEKESQPAEGSKSGQDFEANLIKFELQKVHDIREILLEFTLIQLKENVKSMEMLTSMYNDIVAIDTEKDVEEFEQKFLNKEPNSLKPSNRSQSMSALTKTTKYDKLTTNLSNSTMSLNSPNKDIHSNLKKDTHQSSEDSELDDEEEEEEDEDVSSKSTEETTESEVSRDTKDTRCSTENQSSSVCVDDNDDVQIRPVKAIPRKRSGQDKAEPEKERSVPEQPRPVPQVRFSKMINHMKK